VIRGMIQRASGKEALESTLQQIYFDANGLPQGQARMGCIWGGSFRYEFPWMLGDVRPWGVLGLVDWLR